MCSVTPIMSKQEVYWKTPNCLTRHSSALAPEKRNSWTRNTVSFWSVPGRRLKMPATTLKSIKGSIGVYAGAGMNTYLLHNLYPNRDRHRIGSRFATENWQR